MNRIILSGRLVKKPEIQQFPNGDRSFCVLRIAVDSRSKKTEFFRATVYDKTAETVHRYLKRGSQILLEGRLQQRRYAEAGRWKTIVEVIGESVEFLHKPESQESTKRNEHNR